ncbi:hypothetical protein [Shewanella sp.]|uniref:hypothetical protein n=1 Tax=Shewanella sp. TaxID=50422 RepID=UPI00404773BF
MKCLDDISMEIAMISVMLMMSASLWGQSIVLEKLNTIEQNQIVIANNLKIKLDVISEVCTGKE